jgi:hypothetical protein
VISRFLLSISLIAFAVLLPLSAQSVPDGPNVNQSGGPPVTAYSKLLFRDGSGNVQYSCVAKSKTKLSSLTVTGATNATPIVITTSATHGLATDNIVTITGVLGNTAANGTFTITVVSGTTFSLNSSVGNGAYTSAGAVATFAPRSNDFVWAIQKFYYTGTSLDRFAWSNGTTAMSVACDDRATLSYQ